MVILISTSILSLNITTEFYPEDEPQDEDDPNLPQLSPLRHVLPTMRPHSRGNQR